MVHQEFPSVFYAWKRKCDQLGVRLKMVEPPHEEKGRESAWNEALLEAIDKDTAVVTLSNIHWIDGTKFDLEKIGIRARKVGAAFILDGTQSVGANPFDLEKIPADALICATYKWLTGPYSISVAYFGERYDDGIPIEETWLVRKGSDDFSKLANYTNDYHPGAVRYDVGETSNFVLVPMLLAALQQVLEWDPSVITEYTNNLTVDFAEELRANGFGVAEAPWRSGHLFGIRIPKGIDLQGLQIRLQERKIHVSIRGNRMRISSHLYNDSSDICALREALLC
jgi:selenocysteine lyase/cysteine desulfurase